MVKTILLIGPSQMGKSTLANFLLNEEVNAKKNRFAIGIGTQSTTTVPQSEILTFTSTTLEPTDKQALKNVNNNKNMDVEQVKQEVIKEGLAKEVTISESLRIMDTPGVGDNKNMEEQNMLALYEELAKPEFEISCIVLVIRFPTLVTDAYKSNLRFYKRIFPQVFHTNVVVVLTSAGPKTMARNEQATGISEGEVLRSIANEIRQILELERDLPSFSVDLLSPVGKPAYHSAQQCRRLLLERCVKGSPLKLDDLTFPKPLPWRKEDDGNLKTILERINATNQKLKQKCDLLVSLIEESLNIRSTLFQVDLRLSRIDNDMKVCIWEGVVKADSTFCRWSSKGFKVDVDFPITEVIVAGGSSNYTIEGKSVTGSVRSNWYSELYATISIYTTNRHRHATEILDLKIIEYEITASLEEITKQMDMPEAEKYSAKLTRLEEQANDLRSDTISIEQLRKRIGTKCN